MFNHLVRLPVSFFARRHLGDITSRFGLLATIQKTLTTSVVEAMLDGVMTIAALIAMFMYSWQLATMSIAAVTVYAVIRIASYRAFRAVAGQRLVLAARQNSHFLETLRAITPIKLFGREDERRIKWQNLQVDIQNRDVATNKMNMLYTLANSVVFGIENLAVFWFGSKLIMTPHPSNDPNFVPFTIGMLFAYVNYKVQFSQRISSMINYGIDLRMLNLQSDRLADIALAPPEQSNGLGAGTRLSSLEHLLPSLELRGASFRYGAGEKWVLKDASLKIESGSSVAILGVSGAGKTTVVKVLLGLIQPSEGDVLFGNCSIRQLGLMNYRLQLGSVMQEDALLSGSLSDNISFFDPVRDEVWVRRVASMAQISQEIEGMPMGYQTLVGDLGTGLSGGQRQRLLLARALYKRPKVLVLDEATSHLDIDNERALVAVLAQIGCTRIIISHRPETIALADHAYVLHEGRFHSLADWKLSQGQS